MFIRTDAFKEKTKRWGAGVSLRRWELQLKKSFCSLISRNFRDAVLGPLGRRLQ